MTSPLLPAPPSRPPLGSGAAAGPAAAGPAAAGPAAGSAPAGPAPGVPAAPAQPPRMPARRTGDLERPLSWLWWIGILYVAAGSAVAGMMAFSLFGTSRFVVVVGAAVLLGLAFSQLSRWLRWQLWLRIVILSVVYVVGAVLLATPSALNSVSNLPPAARDSVTAVVLGWKQLLTLDLPLGEYQSVLVPVYLLFLMGSAGAGALATRRSSWAALAVPVVFALGAFGIAFSRTDPGPAWTVLGLRVDAPREVLLGLILVALSLVWLVLRVRLIRRAAIGAAVGTVATLSVKSGTTAAAVRQRLLAVAILVAALVVGLVAGPALASVTPRTTLRTGIEPVLVVQKQPSPLSAYRSYFEAGRIEQPLFAVSGDLQGITRLSVASMDAWDGQQFTVSPQDRFTRLPSGSADPAAQPVSVSVLAGGGGIWMPLPRGVDSAPVFSGPRAEQLSNAFYLDRDSGAGIQIAGGGSSTGLEPGDGYTVRVVPVPDAQVGPVSGSTLLNMNLYPQMDAWLKKQAQPRTADGFVELVRRLRERGYLSHSLEADAAAKDWISALNRQAAYQFQSSYAGHSTGRLESLFKDLNDQQTRAGANAQPGQLVAGVGDDEQFAAAVALLGQAYGYESRVVLGVRLGEKTGGVPECKGTCVGGNLSAWAEVSTPGSGQWAPVDADPQFAVKPSLVTVKKQLPRHPTVPEQPQVQVAQPPSSQLNDHDANQKPAPVPEDSWDAFWPVLRVVGLVSAAVLLVLLPFLVLLLSKVWRRRRRRRARVPEVGVVGAWQDVVDYWVDGGGTLVPGTRGKMARQIGSDAAVELAVLADAAVFAEHPPHQDVAVTAWALARQERRRMAEGRGLWQRIRAGLSLRSMRQAIREHRIWRKSERKSERAAARPARSSTVRRRKSNQVEGNA